MLFFYLTHLFKAFIRPVKRYVTFTNPLGDGVTLFNSIPPTTAFGVYCAAGSARYGFEKANNKPCCTVSLHQIILL